MQNLTPLVGLTAPSGTGKNHVIRHLVSEYKNVFVHVVSDASRPPRGPETQGNPYNFVLPEEFLTKIEQGGYLEYANVNEEDRNDPYGWRGTPVSRIEEVWSAGKIPLLDLNPDGAIAIEKFYGFRAKMIILEPDERERIRRLHARDGAGKYSRAEIDRRIRSGPRELERAKQGLMKPLNVVQYDYSDPVLNELENMVMKWVRPHIPRAFKIPSAQ